MPKQDIEKVIDKVDDEIVGIAKDFVKRRREAYETALKSLKEKMKEDTVRYAELLEDKKISAEDFDLLIKGRAAQLKIEVLEQASISKTKFNMMSDQMVLVLIRGVISLVIAL